MRRALITGFASLLAMALVTREILPPGGRGRRALRRIGRPLPEAIRSFISDAVARWDYSREERRIASAVEAWEEEWEEETGPADGIPVPPARIRIEVDAMRGRWLKGGSTDAKLIREMLRRHGSPIEAMDAILDFGCGCGRVARHWAKLDGPEIHGADISRASVRWCRRNLRFMHADRCGLQPPLSFASGTFDFIYPSRCSRICRRTLEDGGWSNW
jgi:SAM-dependent methyltransferase